MNIEMGKKYQTRDGRAVEILRTNVKNKDFPVVGIRTGFDGGEIQDRWTADGCYYGDCESEHDLIPVPTKHEMWVLITDNNPHRDIGPERYPTLSEAEAWCDKSKGEAVAHITWVSPDWNGAK